LILYSIPVRTRRPSTGEDRDLAKAIASSEVFDRAPQTCGMSPKCEKNVALGAFACHSECSGPGRLDRISGSDTRPFTSAGAGPCAISFWIASEDYAGMLELRCSAQTCRRGNTSSGSSIVALISWIVARLGFGDCPFPDRRQLVEMPRLLANLTHHQSAETAHPAPPQAGKTLTLELAS
jgi:hypothetical protein